MKQICNDIISTSASTWETPVLIYKNANTAIIVNNPDDVNFAYGAQSSVELEYTPVSGWFNARILWKTPNVNDLDVDAAMKEDLPKTFCRLKFRQDGFQFISGVDSIMVNGILTEPDWISVRPHSLFFLENQAPQFYDFICNKIQ